MEKRWSRCLTCVLCCLYSCKFYNEQLTEQLPSSTTVNVPDAGDSGQGAPREGTQTDGVMSEPPSGAKDAGTTPSAPDASVAVESPGCALGQCWWSSERDGCMTAGVPSRDQRPRGDGDVQDSETNVDVYLGWSDLRIAAPPGGDARETAAWQGLGFDIDGVCSNSSTCPNQTGVSCRALTPQQPLDGEQCRDNAFAGVLALVERVPEVGARFGLVPSALNCGLRRGNYNIVARIRDYNGRAEDPNVRVDWYVSDGLDEKPDWNCDPTKSDQYLSYAPWRTSAKWRIDTTGLAGEAPAPGVLPDSQTFDAEAYVHGGYLVSRMPPGAALRLAGDGEPFHGLNLKTQGAWWTGRLQRERDNTWKVSDGLVAGLISNDDALRTFHDAGFCRGTGLDTFYQSVASYILERSDVLVSGENNPETPCDGMSFGIGFSATQVSIGTLTAVPEPVACCLPGRNVDDCSAACGDGKVSGEELCDTTAAAGSAGACPKECQGGDACHPEVLVGDGCSTHCEVEPVTMIIADDGCCPDGADAASDPDCEAVCDNGVIEVGETCDPIASCGTCTSEDACLKSNISGAATSCNIECDWTAIVACEVSDGCCPAGCSAQGGDADCSTTCGDGTLQRDAGETCEPGSAVPCPASCDDNDGCTQDYMTGSAANCNVRCTHVETQRLVVGDGCCPSGATTQTDADCEPRCGNRAVEQGEDCDDGNEADGDGCSAVCKKESPLAACLTSVGRDDACAQCVCERCPRQAAGCYTGDDRDAIKRCSDVVDCVRRERCDGASCYCGADL
ncbi:MAG: hypothetical protein ABW321_15140, partial [Polyangiales bacterium]